MEKTYHVQMKSQASGEWVDTNTNSTDEAQAKLALKDTENKAYPGNEFRLISREVVEKVIGGTTPANS